MAGLRTEYEVVLEDPDERVIIVQVDQRDYAALEVLDGIAADAWHTKGRWLAWNAMRRKKLISASWKDFNDNLCVSVGTKDEPADESEDEEGLDPGRMEVSAGS